MQIVLSVSLSPYSYPHASNRLFSFDNLCYYISLFFIFRNIYTSSSLNLYLTQSIGLCYSCSISNTKLLKLFVRIQKIIIVALIINKSMLNNNRRQLHFLCPINQTIIVRRRSIRIYTAIFCISNLNPSPTYT